MKKRLRFTLGVLLGLVAICGVAAGADTAPVAKKMIVFPFVKIDRDKKEMRVEAETSDEAGFLEFMLIAGTRNEKTKEWNWDRGYESVFVTRASPSHLQVGLLAIGLQPGVMPTAAPRKMSKDNSSREKKAKTTDKDEDKSGQLKEPKKEKHLAPMLDILVEWKEAGQVKQMRVEKFLYSREKKALAPPTAWAFNGSYLVPDKNKKEWVLFSNLTKVIGAVFYDRSAIFNLPYYVGNPYWDGAGPTGFELKPELLPPFFIGEADRQDGKDHWKIKILKRRPVTLIFRASQLKIPVAKPSEKEAPKTKTAKEDTSQNKSSTTE